MFLTADELQQLTGYQPQQRARTRRWLEQNGIPYNPNRSATMQQQATDNELTAQFIRRVKAVTTAKTLQDAIKSLEEFARSIDNPQHRKAIEAAISASTPLIFQAWRMNQIGELAREALTEINKIKTEHSKNP